MKFLNHLMIGQYIPCDSFVHSLDPRLKIVMTVLFLIFMFTVDSLWTFIGWVFLLVLIVRLSCIPFGVVFRGAKPILFLVVITALIHLFFTEGKVLIKIGFLKVTQEGLYLGSLFALRLLLLVIFSGLLTLTTSPLEIADGLEALMRPLSRFGFPTTDVAMMMTIALRFIPTLIDETERIMKAQVSRGANIEEGNIFKRLKAFIPILIPLFMSVFRRAEELAIAMEARCYRGEGRTRMKQLVWSFRDTMVMVIGVLFVFLLYGVDKWLEMLR